MQKNYNCPECGSDRTIKAKILYESGTSTHTSTMAGIGVAAGGTVGFGVAEGRGSSQSELAKKLSPPDKPSSTFGGVIVIISGIAIFIMGIALIAVKPPVKDRAIGWGVFLMLLGGAFVIWAYTTIIKANDKAANYNDENAKWERLWYCFRCAHTFYIQ